MHQTGFSSDDWIFALLFFSVVGIKRSSGFSVIWIVVVFRIWISSVSRIQDLSWFFGSGFRGLSRFGSLLGFRIGFVSLPDTKM